MYNQFKSASSSLYFRIKYKIKVSGGLRIEDDPLIRINIILKDKKIPLKK